MMRKKGKETAKSDPYTHKLQGSPFRNAHYEKKYTIFEKKRGKHLVECRICYTFALANKAERYLTRQNTTKVPSSIG